MTTTWIRRAQWGARAALPIPGRLDPLMGITVHYSTGQELGQADPAAWVRSIQHYHQNVLGYADIAYNALIDTLGNIYEGRANGVLGAHSSTDRNAPPGWANAHTLGVCFLGNNDEGIWDVTPRANQAFVDYFRVVHLALGNRPLAWPHSYWKATACPGDEIRGLIGLWQAAS